MIDASRLGWRTVITALLLDISNIVGGLLLAVPLIRRLPVVGYNAGRFADKLGPFRWIVGIIALVAGGYYVIVHTISGPRLFHFEIVGIAVGVALAWERLTGKKPLNADKEGEPSGLFLLLSIFGLIAILVGVQGLFTPDS
jgi:hypothetical protein